MELKKTISTIFIMPTLKIPREKLKENGFINAYEYDGEKDVNYPNSVCLLFKPPNLHAFREFLEEEYERTTNIIEDYDYNNGFVVVVYKLNAKFLEDFELVKQGKYSQTTKKFQAEYNKTTKIVRDGVTSDEISLQYRIFNKTQDLIDFWENKLGITFEKDQEVWEMYDPDREVLSIKKLRKYV